MKSTVCSHCKKEWPRPYVSTVAEFCEAIRTRSFPLFILLVHQYKKSIMRYIHRLEGSEGPLADDAETIFVNSCTRLLKTGERYDCRKGFFGLWKKTIHRLVKDSAKKFARRRTRPFSTFDRPDGDDPDLPTTFEPLDHRFDQPPELTGRAETVANVQHAIAQLPAEEQAIVLSVMDGNSLRQISRDTDVPYRRILELFNHARTTLRTLLKAELLSS